MITRLSTARRTVFHTDTHYSEREAARYTKKNRCLGHDLSQFLVVAHCDGIVGQSRQIDYLGWPKSSGGVLASLLLVTVHIITHFQTKMSCINRDPRVHGSAQPRGG